VIAICWIRTLIKLKLPAAQLQSVPGRFGDIAFRFAWEV
jgi:hypothetical protein